MLKKIGMDEKIITYFYICVPCQSWICPYIKWNICKGVILPFYYIICCQYYTTSTNILWWRNFAFSPNIIFIITFVAGFINFLAIMQHVPIFLWGVYALWCLCSCGLSITSSNKFINFVLGNTMFVLVLEKVYCSIKSNIVLC